MDIKELAAKWKVCKDMELSATERRRKIEDELAIYYKVSQQDEGTLNFVEDGYKIKLTTKINKSVDSDKLQEIAAEHGLTAKLSNLFRWKAEINTALWRAETDEVRDILSDAITAKPARPTFSIESTIKE